ncbi:hypothetical protein BTN49_0467 [Candidatus Enterovibrio escicola]|uniref:Uncharacterized protein n=1 Tax=Candidatus Enterovibrio escicola TaxID=1927127 RepID=A0A2A5T5L8_9GAMM|nr:hypothetical protein BTN49_0467 [Candidatus Enterovibrio escacola]
MIDKISLSTKSIVSKELAVDFKLLVMDIKVGSRGLMPTYSLS